MRFLSALAALVPLTVASGGDVSGPIPKHASDEAHWQDLGHKTGRSVCFVLPDGRGGDDAPAIMQALNYKCRKDSLVVLPGPEYSIQTNMTTIDMDNVEIHHFGRFLWTDDIEYWRSVSMPVGFQNQSTVWYFGGSRVTLDGHGVGTLDGNGQVWYDWAQDRGNLPRRPMMINWRRLTHSTVRGMRFVQSQMWTMATSQSHDVELVDIYVNNTSTSRWNTINTDGIDTIDSDKITLRRWSVTCGDDAVALKGNSTNVRVFDSVFYGGQGFAIGSVGQFAGEHERVKGFVARNITLHDTTYAIYLKTWGGVSRGFPPNGGGGGLGRMSDLVLDDIQVEGVRRYPFFAWQCENYEGAAGHDCQSSRFEMRDFYAANVRGWAAPGVDHAGWFQCSVEAGGCSGFAVSDISITQGKGGPVLDKWHCENMHHPCGFQCTDWGKSCETTLG